MNADKTITIVIPTFNRKKELEKTLKSLDNQTNKNFNVIISDNAGDYDVNSIINELSDEFIQRITLFVRPYNIGMDANILGCFSLCKSRYLWTLSDDDCVEPNAIELVYKSIDEVRDFGCLNFTLCSDIPLSESGISHIDSIFKFNDLYDVSYSCQSKWHGDLIFVSNKIFDMEKIKDVIVFPNIYMYTGLSIVVLISKMIECGIPYVIINRKIVSYGVETERAWNFYHITLGTRTLIDVPLNITKNEKKRWLRNVSFNMWTIFYTDFSSGKNKEDMNYYDYMYNSLYKYCLKPKQRVVFKMVAFLDKHRFGHYFLSRFFSAFFK